MSGFRVNPQDLRNASKDGYAVAKGIREDWGQAFGHRPPVLGLPHWVFEGAAKAAVQDLGRHLNEITTNRLEQAAGNLITMALSYETADTGAAAAVGGAGGQG
ncbi:hypothetical protein ABZW03_36370 [Kitasatospora sp. NPDC004799]|uniref:hypothetical protein n=1 Tax=Kitasatospora sp. NPDC004799 TaxID=3154460 RepID=UPI00339F82B8